MFITETSSTEEKYDQLPSVANVFESCWPEEEEVKSGWELLEQHCTLGMPGVLGQARTGCINIALQARCVWAFYGVFGLYIQDQRYEAQKSTNYHTRLLV
jgi:hypothetical protein